MSYIITIFKQFKYQLLLIYFYMLVSQLLFLVEPYVIGKMIDGLIHNSFNWLYCFLGILIWENFFVYRRMIYDTKVYTEIYNFIVLRYLNNNESSSSSKVARTEMANNIINFLEHDAHYYIASIITLVGSLAFIFIEHPPTGWVVLSSIIPILIIVKLFYKKIAQGTRVGNTQFENKVDIIQSEDKSLIKSFFERRKRILIYQSTIQGKNWTSLFSTRGIFLLIALIVLTKNNTTLTQGQIISIFTYINQFFIGLMSIPIGMETFTRIKDVIKRINE